MGSRRQNLPLIWLVGRQVIDFDDTRLPTRRDVLAAFFYHHTTAKQTIQKAASAVAVKLMNLWISKQMKVQYKHRVIDKIKKLFTQWKSLHKNKNNNSKRSKALESNEKRFKVYLSRLFDIAHMKSLNCIPEQSKKFLLKCRKNPKSSDMGTNYRSGASQQNSELKISQSIKIECNLSQEPTNDVVWSQSSKSSVSPHPSDPEFKCYLAVPDKKQKLLSDTVCSTLDRSKISDRSAFMALSTMVHSCTGDITNVSISRSTLNRRRRETRLSVAEKLKNKLFSATTVHWDGKLLPDLTGREIVDRLPILVSSGSTEQLLAVPKLTRATGSKVSEAVYEALTEWSINSIVAMSFDTTAANTGVKNGACKNLEILLQRDLLNLACRHHVLELVLRAAYTVCLKDVSQGPDVALFKRFRNKWPQVNKFNFVTSIEDPEANSILNDERPILLDFIQKTLQQSQPRDDYKEFLVLTALYLGDRTKTTFYAPGPVHHARFMNKAIYCLKLYLFQKEFALKKDEDVGIRRMCLFISLVYMKNWFQAPNVLKAPGNDFQFLQSMIRFRTIDEPCANAALNKFEGHLWYLSEELVCLAFFDENVNNLVKEKMVTNLEIPGNQERVVRATVNSEDLQNMDLSNFVTVNSLRFFEILGVEPTFLKIEDVGQWETDKNFQYCRTLCSNLRAVNDVAERGVALVQEYNSILTNDEEQKQYLLLLVQEHRARFTAKKEDMIQCLKKE